LVLGFVPLKKRGSASGPCWGRPPGGGGGVCLDPAALALDAAQGNFSPALSAEPDFEALLAQSGVSAGSGAGIADGVYTGSGTGF
jgi:hypothetical protein